MLQTVYIADINIWSYVLLHLVLYFQVHIRLLDFQVGAAFEELLMSSV
jgi:hypothetical protein